MLSKSTTRQTLPSKSLCRFQNHAFGLVPTNRYFHDSNKSDFCSKPPESLYLQASYYPYSFTLDINTTVSTCLECANMSTIFMHFYAYLCVTSSFSAIIYAIIAFLCINIMSSFLSLQGFVEGMGTI